MTGPARDSIGDALRIAVTTGDATLARVAQDSFVSAIASTSLIGVVGGIVAAVVAVVVLRPKPRATATEDAVEEPASQLAG